LTQKFKNKTGMKNKILEGKSTKYLTNLQSQNHIHKKFSRVKQNKHFFQT